jgi:uncharacterized membrane protein YhaH (DUF805 family)
VDWVYLLTGFAGRISRQPFWIAIVGVFAAEILVHMVAQRIEGDRLSAIVDLAFSFVEFAIFAKRGHDRNVSTWVPGSIFLGSVLIDLLVVLGLGQLHGELNVVQFLTLPLAIFSFALLLDFGLRPGTAGPNRFGPDPLAPTTSPQ